MNSISNVFVTDYIPTIYTTPGTLKYNQNNQSKSSDFFLERNGVVIILYNSTRDVLVLVKQFRPSVYFQDIYNAEKLEKNKIINLENYPASHAVTLEFCAGLEDKNNMSTEQIAQEEIFEECGYQVPLESLEKILNFCNLTETTGARSTFYYCEVTDDQKIDGGGGGCIEENEKVEVVEMKIEDVIEYSRRTYVCAPANFLFGLNWFLYHKYNGKHLLN